MSASDSHGSAGIEQSMAREERSWHSKFVQPFLEEPLAYIRAPVMNVIAGRTPPSENAKMNTFTIENETNNLTLHATAQEAEAVAHTRRFHNEAGLAKLAGDWPMAKLVTVWNRLPGRNLGHEVQGPDDSDTPRSTSRPVRNVVEQA